MKVLITAGGTRVPLDDVRDIGNRSRGSFLWSVALAFSRRGDQVVVIGSEVLHERVRQAVPLNVTFVPFVTYDDLAIALEAQVATTRFDVVLMGAAVSDYGPRHREAGKISSNRRVLHLTLDRLPKLLPTLRDRCGRATFIVGFKLTSGASEAELSSTAHHQTIECRLNLTVANDSTRLGGGQHPVLLVTPEGGSIPLAGSRAEVAAELVSFVVTRTQTTWYHSEYLGPVPTAEQGPARTAASKLLRFAQSARLLTGRDGNVSFRDGSRIWVTPRGVPRKRTLRPQRLVLATVDHASRTISYLGRSGDKPSIDTPVHGRLYRELPNLAATLHFHGGWVVTDLKTTFPYPCGTEEEAREITSTIALAAAGSSAAGPLTESFAVELVSHGHLVCLTATDAAALPRRWAALTRTYASHLADIGATDAGSNLELTPIFRSAEIVGIAARHPDGWASFFLLDELRRTGTGQRLLDLADARRQRIGVHPGCGVLDYYLSRGFRQVGQGGEGVVLLDPPSLRQDLVPAATACLYCATTDEVLLVKRAHHPWGELWANPGGNLGRGESPWAAAQREVEEEVGIDLSPYVPSGDPVRLAVSWRSGERSFAVTSFLVPILTPHVPNLRDGEVAEARWVKVGDALSLPMNWGTAHVIRTFLKR